MHLFDQLGVCDRMKVLLLFSVFKIIFMMFETKFLFLNIVSLHIFHNVMIGSDIYKYFPTKYIVIKQNKVVLEKYYNKQCFI